MKKVKVVYIYSAKWWLQREITGLTGGRWKEGVNLMVRM